MGKDKVEMGGHKIKEPEVEEDLKGRTPVLVGTKDGSCFYGEVEPHVDMMSTVVSSQTLRLHNCQMVLSLGKGTKGWFDLAGRGPDASCGISPPVELAVISEITKVLACTEAATRRWKAQGSVVDQRIITGRNQ